MIVKVYLVQLVSIKEEHMCIQKGKRDMPKIQNVNVF